MKRASLHACHFRRLVIMPRKPILHRSISASICLKALKSRSKMLMLDVNFRDGTKQGLSNSQLRWNPYIMTRCWYAISSCKRKVEGGTRKCGVSWLWGVCINADQSQHSVCPSFPVFWKPCVSSWNLPHGFVHYKENSHKQMHWELDLPSVLVAEVCHCVSPSTLCKSQKLQTLLIGRDPCGSLSAALKWMSHTGIELNVWSGRAVQLQLLSEKG